MCRSSTRMDKARSVNHGFPPGSNKDGGRSPAEYCLIFEPSWLFEFCLLFFFVTSYLGTTSAANFSMQGTSSGTSFNCKSNLICLGQAHEYTRNNTNGKQDEILLSLIREPPYLESNQGAGVAYYNERVRFLDTPTRQSASFYTSFSMDKVELKPPHHGDGMAFVISADGKSLGSERAFFGIFDTDGITRKKSIVVEFDSHQNRGHPMYDISDNHVSVDFSNMTTTAAANASAVGVVLYSNLTTYAWVEYSNYTQQLEVRISNNNSRPIRPLLNCTVDLFEVTEEYMWVGFSAGSGDFYDNYYVGAWTFESFGIPPSGPPPSFTQQARDNMRLIVKIAIFIPALLIACTFIMNFVEKLGGVRWQPIAQDDPILRSMEMPESFSYKELSRATNGFSEESKLGKGGSGTVYRGLLPTGITRSGIPVAVKKIDSAHSEREFMSEVSIISRLRHKNLIKLLGWCGNVSKREYLLVYELMSNGSLDNWLSRPGFRQAEEETAFLSWLQRVNIVKGIALALQYMHHGCTGQVIHRDIKSSNIMLDDHFNVKLGDFGLSRVVDHQGAIPTSGNLGVDIDYIAPEAFNAKFSLKTTLCAGTPGYIAPEIMLESSKCTDKTDVYAFGVVVLEIACGRRSVITELPREEKYLVDWVWHRMSEGKLLTVLEKPLCYYDEQHDPVWMDPEVMLKIGLLCTHNDPELRPSMEIVVRVLAGVIEVPTIRPRTGLLGPEQGLEACSCSTSRPESVELACGILSDSTWTASGF